MQNDNILAAFKGMSFVEKNVNAQIIQYVMVSRKH